MKTRADRTSVASAVLGAEQNPAPKAQQAEAPARPLGPSGSLAPSEQTVAAEHLGGHTMAQRALGMLHMGRMLRPEGTISEIGAMTGVISEVNSFVGVVASATEEQRAASQEISDRLGRVSDGIRDMANNVTQAAEVTQEVTTNVASVSTNTAQVDSTATALRSAVQSLDASAEGLELAVSRLTE